MSNSAEAVRRLASEANLRGILQSFPTGAEPRTGQRGRVVRPPNFQVKRFFDLYGQLLNNRVTGSAMRENTERIERL